MQHNALTFFTAAVRVLHVCACVHTYSGAKGQKTYNSITIDAFTSTIVQVTKVTSMQSIRIH